MHIKGRVGACGSDILAEEKGNVENSKDFLFERIWLLWDTYLLGVGELGR